MFKKGVLIAAVMALALPVSSQTEGPLRPPSRQVAVDQKTEWEDLRKFCTSLPESKPEKEPPPRLAYVELLEEALDAINRINPYAPEIIYRAEHDEALKVFQRLRRRAENSRECEAAQPLRSLFAYLGTRRLQIRAGTEPGRDEETELRETAEQAIATLRKEATARPAGQ